MRKNKITDRSAIIRPVELCRFSVFFLFVRGIRISYSIRRNTGLNLLLYIIFIISENFIDAKLRKGTLNWNFFSKRTMDNCDELLSFLPIDSWFNLFFLLRTEFPFTPRFVVWNRFSGWAKQRRINVIVEEEQCVYTNRVCRETETKREREREVGNTLEIISFRPSYAIQLPADSPYPKEPTKPVIFRKFRKRAFEETIALIK